MATQGEFGMGIWIPWATPDVDDRIRQWRNENVSYGQISQRLTQQLQQHITTSQVMRRGKTLGLSVPGAGPIKKDPIPDPTPVDKLPEWGTPAAKELLRIDRLRGCSAQQMADRWGVNINTVDRWSVRVGARTGVVKKPDVAPVEVNRRMASPNGGRPTSFTGLSWCMATLPKPALRAPGVCSWPLSCDGAAVGRFCAEHAGLIGKRAA
jgi:hypothetical protein